MENDYTLQKGYTDVKKMRETLEKANLLKDFEEARRIFTIAFKYIDQFAYPIGSLLMAASFDYMFERGSESFRQFFQEDNSYALLMLPHVGREDRDSLLGIEEAVKALEKYLDTTDMESFLLTEEDLDLTDLRCTSPPN